MIKNNIKYFSSGEFAKLFNINKKTLFHYDDIDLLKPERIESNGYRYYSEYQIEMFRVISTLKDTGMSLKEIKNYINNRSPENMISLFEYEINEIELEIQNLRKKQQALKTKVSLINEGLNIKEGIFLANLKEEYLVLSEIMDSDLSPFDLKCYSNFIQKSYKHNLYYGHPIGAIKTKNDLFNDRESYTYYYIRVDKDCDYKDIFIKPKGLYVVSYVKGYYSDLPPVYDKMLDFINDNNLAIIGWAYEDVIIEEVAVKNPNDFVIKISIQVKHTR